MDALFIFIQVNLVEWVKMIVGSKRTEEVVDPNLDERPVIRALKRVLLVALRSVDPDAAKRPKMSQIVQMLEAVEALPREVNYVLDSSNIIIMNSSIG
jgi:hypothetical protein